MIFSVQTLVAQTQSFFPLFFPSIPFNLQSSISHASFGFADQINYKVGVALDQSGNLVIRSVCFFCDNGNPTFLTYSNVRDPFTFTYFPDFTENLNGKIITLSVPRIVSLIEQDPDINGGIRNIKRGRHKQLFNDYLTLALNFTYHAIPSTGHGTGVRLANGTMIGA